MTELHVSGIDELKRAHSKAMASICKDVAMGMLASSDDLAEVSRQLSRAMYSATDAFGDYHEAYDDAVDPDDFSTDHDRWYCRYCGSANHPDALYCGEIIDGRGVRRCGAPKPKDGAELPEELAAIRDIPRDMGINVDFTIEYSKDATFYADAVRAVTEQDWRDMVLLKLGR